MNETKLLESTVSEYSALLTPARSKAVGQMDKDRLVRELARAHDWTDLDALAIVSLATEYGVFMLRNALALAIVFDKQDGDLGF